MITDRFLSGEVASKKARLVLYPLLILYIINLLSSVVRSQITGYSGFTSGAPDPTGYSVVQHGQAIHVSVGQYWFGRTQIFALVVGAAAWLIARAHFFRTGDLRREERTSKDALEPIVPT